MKNLLVAVDFDQRTNKLIDFAEKIALKFKAKVWIVHIAAPDPDFVGYEPGPQYIRDFRAGELKNEHKRLISWTEQLSKRGVESEALLIQGPTVKMILKEAQDLKADLLITGSHDHSFVYNAFVGSTALEIFKKSNIPLLTVPVGEE